MKLLSSFGIDYRILLAQLLNFAILAFILYKIGYKPILSFIKERQAVIAKGVNDASSAEEIYKKSQEERNKLLAKTRTEASELIEDAKKRAMDVGEKEVGKVKETIDRIKAMSKEEIASEKEKMLVSVKAEMAEIAIEGAEKILSDKVDEKISQNWTKSKIDGLASLK